MATARICSSSTDEGSLAIGPGSLVACLPVERDGREPRPHARSPSSGSWAYICLYSDTPRAGVAKNEGWLQVV